MSETPKTQKSLVDHLIGSRILRNERAIKAMLKVDRKHFVLSGFEPYKDAPSPLGHGATISAPHMHAVYVELLSDHLVPGARVLDVGSGSGYMTALMGEMVSPGGVVVGVDQIASLVNFSLESIRAHNANLLIDEIVKVFKTDGRLGCEDYAPYDAIHVGAAADKIPEKLADQLKEGGRMIIPMSSEHKRDWGGQELFRVDKVDGELVMEKIGDVDFVPLGDFEDFYY